MFPISYLLTAQLQVHLLHRHISVRVHRLAVNIEAVVAMIQNQTAVTGRAGTHNNTWMRSSEGGICMVVTTEAYLMFVTEHKSTN